MGKLKIWKQYTEGIDNVRTYPLGGFLHGIFITCVFIRRVDSLLARLNLTVDEVDGYTNSVKIVSHLTQNL